MPKTKPYDLSKVTTTDLAYLAGFVDGEGCFYIGYTYTKSATTNRKYPNYHTILKISNNCVEVLEWINNTFGGRITTHNKKKKMEDRNFITYEVYMTGNLLTDLTEMLIPYLIVKKPQAEIMLRMRQTFSRTGSRGPNKPLEEIVKFREECHLNMHRLNSRFKHHHAKKDLYQHLAPCHPIKQLGSPSQSEEIYTGPVC